MGKTYFLFYCKSHKKSIILNSVFLLLFTIIFLLYQLPMEALLYAFILCLMVLLIFVSYDYHRYRTKHQKLQKMKQYTVLSTMELPDTKELIEKDYLELIQLLIEENKRFAMSSEKGYEELVDYYTMWVHQIKTPIAALRLLIQSKFNDSELLNELFKIEQYVEMVLSYLRMESLSGDLLVNKYSLDDVIRQAIRKFAFLFVQKKLRLNYDALYCEVLTDEKWLLFVIEQILSNAIKYTAEGGTISIYMDTFHEKTLVIEDTGIGIEEEDIKRVFEKGFTGYNGRTDKRSTGIGLYLCKKIVSKLSHTITIESKVSVGTKVKIDLHTIEMD